MHRLKDPQGGGVCEHSGWPLLSKRLRLLWRIEGACACQNYRKCASNDTARVGDFGPRTGHNAAALLAWSGRRTELTLVQIATPLVWGA